MKTRLLLLIGILASGLAYSQLPATGTAAEYLFTGGALGDLTQTGAALTQVSDRSGLGDAIDLNGDYLRRGTFNASNITASFWIKTSTNDADKRIIIDHTNRAQHLDNINEQGWYTYLINGQVGFAANFYHSHFWNGSTVGNYSGYAYTAGTTVIADGEWHHVAVTAQKSIYHYGMWMKSYTYKIYIDGVLEGSQVVARNSGSSSSNIHAALLPGTSVTIAQNSHGNLPHTYQDEIDDLRFYTSPLEESDIQLLAAEGVCEPMVISQDVTVQLDAAGNASVVASTLDNGSTNDCGIVGALTFTLDKSSFTCADVGTNVVTLTAEDIYGNKGTSTATVTVEDVTVPTAVAQDIAIQIDAITGIAIITPEDIDDGSTDNCSASLMLSLSKTEFSCDDIGANVITLTVEDTQGNQATDNATVTITSAINDETVTVTDPNNCPNGSSTTITTGGSVVDVNYYLRNSNDNSIVDGPIVGTGSGLSFNTGSVNQTTTYNVYGEILPPAKYALDFDGVNDHVIASVPSGFNYSSAYTIEAWVKSPLPGASGGYEAIFFAGTSTVSDVEVYVQQGSDDMVVVHNRGNGGTLQGVPFPDPPNDTWYHLAVAYDGTNVEVFYDGVSQGSQAIAPPIATGSASINIGYVQSSAFDPAWGVKNFAGQMDDFRLWSTAKNATEINSTMNNSLVGNETGLTAYYDFEDGSGTIATDKVNGNNGTLMNMDSDDWITDTPLPGGQGCGVQMITEVTVGEDNTNPTPVAQDITVQLDASGNVTITGDDINDGSSDDCTAADALILSLSKTSFSCSDLGTNTVTLTVEDLGGNTATADVTVTVEDNVNPVAIAQDLVVALDASGNASITVAEVNDNSSDNCTTSESLVLSLDKTAFTCSDLGENIVTLTVEDASGNQSTVTSTVSVEDVISPVAVANDITVYLDASGTASVDPNSLDNGSSDFCSDNLSFDLSQSTFSCSDIGENSVTLTVIDDSGNSATAPATITVIDNIAPVAVAKDITVRLDANNSAVITASDVDDSSSDNCSLTLSIDLDTFNETNLGANTVTLTVADLSGNSSTATATVTVEEFKQDQTISFNGIADKTYGDANFTISANASSGLSVTYAVISGPAAMSGNTLTLTGIGTVIVEAEQTGNDDFYSASAQQTFSVLKATLSVTADDQSIVFGDALPALTFEYSGFVNGETNADLTQEPIISTTATNTSDAGTYAIALIGGQADNYTIVTTDGELTIEKADQVISLEEINDRQPTDDPFDVVASVNSGLQVTYDVSGPATISGSTITLDGTNGTVTVTVSQSGDVNHNAAESKSVSFKVSEILAASDGLKDAVSIYPNPVTEFVVVETDEPVSINFYTFSGKLVMALDNVHGQIDVSDLKTGRYLMEIVSKDQRFVRKILKAN